MIALGLTLCPPIAVEGSYFHRALEASGQAFRTVRRKAALLDLLARRDFDVLVSNGCPFILPAGVIDDPARTFVNVHPSPLPDLPGVDPVPGALLFGRDSGASCHVMDAGIDTGPLIAREVIPYDPAFDADLLYHLSFRAEVAVFERALARGFAPDPALAASHVGDIRSYMRREADLWLDFAEAPEAIARRVAAFSNAAQGARLRVGEATVVVRRCAVVRNGFLTRTFAACSDRTVVLRYGPGVLVRRADAFLRLDGLEGDTADLAPGVRV
nr:formyltransferase family protein [Roseospira goensis]